MRFEVEVRRYAQTVKVIRDHATENERWCSYWYSD
jgi:hypothetical protein